jgi:nucleoside-diphosphate-sugar epimerase
MRIFVTGATGFIGAHFIECALDAGHSIVGLYRSDTARQQQLIEHLRSRGAVLQRGDVLDSESIEAAIGGAECVCHFAAAFRESDADQAYFDRLNIEGTANVLKAAHAAGVKRFVHCSTAGIHGQRVKGVIDERTPVRPWNSYERSKVAAEEQVRGCATAAGTEYVILRPTAVYGPRDERLQKLFRAVARGRFPLFGRGEGRRHMVYVSDLADAFVRACTVPGAANQAFIIAGPEAVPLKEMLTTLAQVSNRRTFGPRLPLKPMMWVAAITEDLCGLLKIKPPLYRRRMDFYMNDAAFSSERAQQVLGWKPKVSLSEGLGATFRSTFPEKAAARVIDSSAVPAGTRVTARQLRGMAFAVLTGLIALASAIEWA